MSLKLMPPFRLWTTSVKVLHTVIMSPGMHMSIKAIRPIMGKRTIIINPSPIRLLVNWTKPPIVLSL